MPDHYPFIERDQADSGLLAYLDPRPVLDFSIDTIGGALVNPNGAPNAQNAAGTAENLALHVAFVVVFAGVGVWALRTSGFKFVASVGVG